MASCCNPATSRDSLLMRVMAVRRSPQRTRPTRPAVSSTPRIHLSRFDAPAARVELVDGRRHCGALVVAEVPIDTRAKRPHLRRDCRRDGYGGKHELDRRQHQLREPLHRREVEEHRVLRAVVREVPRREVGEVLRRQPPHDAGAENGRWLRSRDGRDAARHLVGDVERGAGDADHARRPVEAAHDRRRAGRRLAPRRIELHEQSPLPPLVEVGGDGRRPDRREERLGDGIRARRTQGPPGVLVQHGAHPQPVGPVLLDHGLRLGRERIELFERERGEVGAIRSAFAGVQRKEARIDGRVQRRLERSGLQRGDGSAPRAARRGHLEVVRGDRRVGVRSLRRGRHRLLLRERRRLRARRRRWRRTRPRDSNAIETRRRVPRALRVAELLEARHCAGQRPLERVELSTRFPQLHEEVERLVVRRVVEQRILEELQGECLVFGTLDGDLSPAPRVAQRAPSRSGPDPPARR